MEICVTSFFDVSGRVHIMLIGLKETDMRHDHPEAKRLQGTMHLFLTHWSGNAIVRPIIPLYELQSHSQQYQEVLVTVVKCF
jgi:hypothetical protein